MFDDVLTHLMGVLQYHIYPFSAPFLTLVHAVAPELVTRQKTENRSRIIANIYVLVEAFLCGAQR